MKKATKRRIAKWPEVEAAGIEPEALLSQPQALERLRELTFRLSVYCQEFGISRRQLIILLSRRNDQQVEDVSTR